MDAPPPEPENFDSLSLADRLSHKSWKARLSAYNSLISTFKQTISEDDPAFKLYFQHPGMVREWVRDSNAVSQEKGVEAACALVEWGGEGAARGRSEVVPSLVEKCLGSARAGTRDKAIELCLLYVEVEEDQGEGVINDILPGLDLKQPKIVAGCVKVLSTLIKAFSPKSLHLAPILKSLPKIFSNVDKAVRLEGTTLAVVLHSYLGPGLTPHLSELKPVQVKELNEGFVEADGKGEGVGTGKKSRWGRREEKERKRKEAMGTLEGKGGEEEEEEPPEEEDPLAYLEPVDILSQLPPEFYPNLSSTKWKDRSDLSLAPLLTLLKASPKLLPSSNYTELTTALSGRITGDANVVCVALAANCLEMAAKGLRGEFGKYKEICLGAVLGRTKEKKASVLDALGAALDAIFTSMTISDLPPLLAPYTTDKNPSVRQSSLLFLYRSLSSSASPPQKSDLQPLTDILKVALEDSTEPVRAAAADAFGTLIKCVGGERAFGGQVEGLEEKRREKVREAVGRVEIRCKPGLGGEGGKKVEKEVVKEKVVGKLKVKPSIANKENGPPIEVGDSPAPVARAVVPKASGPPRLVAKKSPPVASAPAVKKPTPSTSSKPPSPSAAANEPLKFKFSQEDAEAQAEVLLPSNIVTELGDSNWKVRLGAIESLGTWLEGEGAEVESEIVCRFLSKKPGWKESNFQVSSKMFGIFQLLGEQSKSFSKGSAAISIPALSDKLGDMKLKKPAGDALNVFAEKTSLQFVLGQAYEPMTKQKAPKAQADAYLWVEQSIRDFGVAGISVRDLIEFLKVGLKSTNAAVRTNATKALVTLRIFVGAEIVTFLQDLNPTLLTTIESEFAKVSAESPPEPTRFSADVVAAAPAGGKGKGNAGGADPLDELIPRVDLDKLLSSANVAGCNDANWKMRKEALEHIQGVLEANKRLKPSTLSDLTTALKLRMTDSNKVVQSLALDVVARIATGMGKPFDKLARIFAGPVAGVLADQKTNIRAAGTTTLSAMADAAGLDSLIGGFDKPLEAPNPLLRKELLAWLETRFADEEVVATLDLTCLAGPILGCLEDKSAEVRKSAINILPAIVARAGYNTVMDQASKLKPASKSTVVSLIETAKAAAPARAAAPATKSSAPTPPPPSTSAVAPSAPATRAPLGPSRPTAKVLRPAAPSPVEEPVVVAAPSIRARPSLGGIRPKMTPATPRASAPTSATKEAPFRSSDPDFKRVRASKESGSLKWAVEGTPRPDQVDALYQQMAPNTSSELLGQLFSKDHSAERDFIAGLALLSDCARDPQVAASFDLSLEEMRARLVANVDVIFKYITLRIGMTNTAISLKCLDLVENLIPVLDVEGHKLSDYEMSALLLSLINKVGDSKETIRQRVRVLLQSICNVYPFSKVFAAVLENGLNSKNARTRAESAEELGGLIQRHGVGPFPIPKALPLLAKLISDRDAAVRTAALTAIGAVYTLMGPEGVYKYIGAIPDKERTMLEERLKRTSSGSAPLPPPLSTTAVRPATPPVQRPITPASPPRTQPSVAPLPPRASIPGPRGIPSGISRIGGGRPPSVHIPAPLQLASASNSIERATTSPRSSGGSGLPTRQSILRPPTSALAPPSSSRLVRTRPTIHDEELPLSTSSEETARMIDAIVSNDLAKSADVLKQIQREISLQAEYLVPAADDLMEAVTQQMNVAFTDLNRDSPLVVLRLCKHLMQTLSAFFDHKTLGRAVSTPALTALLGELTGRLLDTAEDHETEAISSLSKVLNMVLIRIFHHSDQTACFSALFSVLQEATIDLRDLRGEELADRAKYAELVMKCLWKVSKTVKESLEGGDLSPSRLLLDINTFLDAIPPAEWRRRATDNIPLADMPLRTVKTILQQIVTVYGEQVFDHLEEIEAAESSFVYQYLFRLASTTAESNGRDIESIHLTRNPSISSMSSVNRIPPSNYQPPLPLSPTFQHQQQLQKQQSQSTLTSLRNGSVSEANGNGLRSPGGEDIEINNRLKEIFDLIGDPGQSRRGIEQLYEYQKAHPEASVRISNWMAETGNYFQTYLRRALDNLAAADRERGFPSPDLSRAPSSASLGNRPDSGASSPGVAPISTGANLTRLTGPRLSGGNTPGRLQELKSMFGYVPEQH